MRSLSPVIITTSIPILCRFSIALLLSGLIVSATAIIPIKRLSYIKHNGVFPSADSSSAVRRSSAGITVWLSINLMLPPVIRLPSRTALRPFPGRAEKSDTSDGSFLSSSAFAITAFARGCSLLASRETATFKSCSLSYPFAAIISVTLGVPSVIVPVLSSATILTFPAFSSVSAVLNKIPFFAPTPLPTIIATGVASPSAHGQLITRTDMLRARA